MGRPKKEINQKFFENLCAIQCTKKEICSVLEASEKTLDAWCREKYGKSFSLVFKEKREGGKVSLRRKQWQMAESSVAMAIFLGKQLLDQEEKPHEKELAKVKIESIKLQNERARVEIRQLKEGIEGGEVAGITIIDDYAGRDLGAEKNDTETAD